jgi:hypothetical protein
MRVYLKLYTLRKSRYHLDSLSLVQVYHGYFLKIAGLRIPTRYIRDFSMFNVCFSGKHCPSARCASAANVVCRDVDYLEPNGFS